jgi:TonB family protein
MIKVAEIALVALMAAGSAMAEEKMLDPAWVQTPSWREMQAAFPPGAQSDTGSVTLRCSVGSDGALSACAASYEKPTGQGFSEAALSLAPRFVMETPSASGQVDVPFSFTRPGTRDGRALLSPRWVHPMSIEEQRALYPAEAAPSTRIGAAIVRCAVTPKGRLDPCKVVEEAPVKQGFGDAALQTARRMTMNPWSESGYPYEGLKVTFRLSFARQ